MIAPKSTRIPFLLFVSLLTILAVVPCRAGNDTHLPQEVLSAGYTSNVFYDDFHQIDLERKGSSFSTWYNGLWYEEKSSLDRIVVKDGVLSLITPSNFRHTSIATVPKEAGGITFKHGFFEARMRFAENDVDWSAFWLMSRPHSLDTDNGHWCEIDIFEHFGAGRYVGAIHDWTRQKHTFNKNANHWFSKPVKFSEWHNYGLLWTAQKLTWFLDGDPLFETESSDICEQQDMFLVLSSQRHTDGPEQRLDVDWVRVFERQ
ncbi:MULTISPECIES: family 16 glycosylhydrolase [unclassified Bradyrhizobium]|uniref:glycoside hydrolase family 16 protein n=1 Tax=unclassified Bradyrhizobium TaxID=2631580 RepID=UPI003395C215